MKWMRKMNDTHGVPEPGSELVPSRGGPPVEVGSKTPDLPRSRRRLNVSGWRAKLRSVVSDLLDVADELADAVTVVVDQIKRGVKKG